MQQDLLIFLSSVFLLFPCVFIVKMYSAPSKPYRGGPFQQSWRRPSVAWPLAAVSLPPGPDLRLRCEGRLLQPQAGSWENGNHLFNHRVSVLLYRCKRASVSDDSSGGRVGKSFRVMCWPYSKLFRPLHAPSKTVRLLQPAYLFTEALLPPEEILPPLKWRSALANA